jgi:putative PIN family toxin of toxin-antitoxin system
MRVAVDANIVLSGLFFPGNERRLLLAALRGDVTLVLAEDIVEEVYAVVEETFRDHAELPAALDLLAAVLGSGELVPREAYARELGRWAGRIRDPADAPLLACAQAVRAECIVTGDRDVLELRDAGGLAIFRTRELPRRLRE